MKYCLPKWINLFCVFLIYSSSPYHFPYSSVLPYSRVLPTDRASLRTGSIPFLYQKSGCESWTIKKAEHWRIDAFRLRCWRRLLRVPWTARGSNQSILKEINPEYSLEGLILKLKLQYFGHLVWRANSWEKTLIPGRIEGRRRTGDRGWDGWLASLTQWTWVCTSSEKWWRTGKPEVLQPMEFQKVRHDWATEQQQQ